MWNCGNNPLLSESELSSLSLRMWQINESSILTVEYCSLIVHKDNQKLR